MTGIDEQPRAIGIPCALQHYLSTINRDGAVIDLDRDESIKALQYWLDKHHSTTSTRSTKEHLICPMLWCRDTFEHPLDTLNHLSECCWLSNSWYWCPTCSRPETFRDWGDSNNQVPLQRKGSKLKRAVTFFKHFGRKASVKRRIRLPVSCSKVSTLGDPSYYIYDKAELNCEDGSREVPGSSPQDVRLRSELGSRLSHTIQHELPPADDRRSLPPYAKVEGSWVQNRAVLSTVRPVHELSDPGTLPHELPSRLTHVVSHELDQPGDNYILPFYAKPYSTSIHNYWEESHQLAARPQVYDEVSTAVGHIYAETPVLGFEMEYNGRLPKATSLISPMSIDAHLSPSLTHDPISPISEISSECSTSFRSMLGPHSHFPRPSIGSLHTTTTDISAWDMENHLSSAHTQLTAHPLFTSRILHNGAPTSVQLSNSEPSGMESLVTDLGDFVSVVNREWLQRLSRHPDTSAECSLLPVHKVLELGIITLESCFSGKFPSRFLDVFALMQVALASTYMLHGNDTSYDWDPFVRDMSTWKYTITEQIGKAHFMRCMNELSDSLACITASQTPHLQESGTGNLLLGSLHNGRVVRHCAMWLTYHDHARIVERNRPLLPAHFAFFECKTTNIEMMLSQIIRPLQRVDGIELFRDIITDAEYSLRSGRTRDIWELEVTLLANAREYSKYSQPYNKYSKATATLCDRAMKSYTWRDPYYATTSKSALATFFELEKRQRRQVTDRPIEDVSQRSNSRNDIPELEDLPIPHSETNSSPVSTRSASTMGSSWETLHESTSSSPTTLCTQSSVTTPTPSSPNQSTQEAHCNECGKVYTGNSCITNLQRHLRCDKAHNQIGKYKCLDPNCNRSFGRPDNQKQHFRIAHPSTAAAQLERRGAVKRRRKTSDETGRIPVPDGFF